MENIIKKFLNKIYKYIIPISIAWILMVNFVLIPANYDMDSYYTVKAKPGHAFRVKVTCARYKTRDQSLIEKFRGQERDEKWIKVFATNGEDANAFVLKHFQGCKTTAPEANKLPDSIPLQYY